MVTCSECGAESVSGSRFCAQCGAGLPIAVGEGRPVAAGAASATVAATSVEEGGSLIIRPASSLWGPPKRRLFERPLTSDWTFWIFIAFAVVGGLRNTYRSGQGYRYSSLEVALFGALFDVVVTLLVAFGFVALVPALIRALVRRFTDKRALAERPADVSEGWKSDPLNVKRQRWWSGSGWTQAVKPEPSSKVGAPSWWILGGLLTLMMVAFIAGRSSEPAPDFSNVDVDALTEELGDTRQFMDEPRPGSDPAPQSNPNTAMAIGLYFSDLVDAITAYSQTPVDPMNVEVSMVDARAAFEDVETNYILLSGALPAVATQAQLGPGAPDLGALREFVDAMGPYVQARLDYYAALDECGPMVATRVWGECEFDAAEEWEKPMVDTIPPVSAAFEAVIESVPQDQ